MMDLFSEDTTCTILNLIIQLKNQHKVNPNC